MSYLMRERRRISTFVQEGGEQYLKIPFSLKEEETKLTRCFDPMPFVPAKGQERQERCAQILEIQAHGLKKRLSHTGAQTAVIGVSGGLDSTLALLVTARAFDRSGKRQGKDFGGDGCPALGRPTEPTTTPAGWQGRWRRADGSEYQRSGKRAF